MWSSFNIYWYLNFPFVVKRFWSWILGHSIPVQKEKEKFAVLCFKSFTQSCSRMFNISILAVTDGKEKKEKHDALCSVV